MSKLLRYGIIVLLFFIQILFLLTMFKENTHSYLLLIFISSLLILTFYTYRKAQLHDMVHAYESYKVAVWVPVGAVFSYYLNHTMGLGPVLAASVVGAIASFIPNMNTNSAYLKKLPPAVYCGAFIGMSNTQIANGFTFILTASFFTAVFLVISKSVLNGIGGKLGTLAFLGVALTYFLIFLLG
ncbi:hypothetical protein [Pseudopedobacter beijingensis]